MHHLMSITWCFKGELQNQQLWHLSFTTGTAWSCCISLTSCYMLCVACHSPTISPLPSLTSLYCGLSNRNKMPKKPFENITQLPLALTALFYFFVLTPQVLFIILTFHYPNTYMHLEEMRGEEKGDFCRSLERGNTGVTSPCSPVPTVLHQPCSIYTGSFPLIPCQIVYCVCNLAVQPLFCLLDPCLDKFWSAFLVLTFAWFWPWVNMNLYIICLSHAYRFKPGSLLSLYIFFTYVVVLPNTWKHTGVETQLRPFLSLQISLFIYF